MKGKMEGYLVKPEEHEIPSPWTEFEAVGEKSRDAGIYAIWECDPKSIFLNAISSFSQQILKLI